MRGAFCIQLPSTGLSVPKVRKSAGHLTSASLYGGSLFQTSRLHNTGPSWHTVQVCPANQPSIVLPMYIRGSQNAENAQLKSLFMSVMSDNHLSSCPIGDMAECRKISLHLLRPLRLIIRPTSTPAECQDATTEYMELSVCTRLPR